MADRYLQTALARHGSWTLEIVKRSKIAFGFELLPPRWVFKRSIARLNRHRSLAKDVARLIQTAAAWLILPSIRPLSRRLAKRMINPSGFEAVS